jgi:hypothetical protein
MGWGGVRSSVNWASGFIYMLEENLLRDDVETKVMSGEVLPLINVRRLCSRP